MRLFRATRTSVDEGQVDKLAANLGDLNKQVPGKHSIGGTEGQERESTKSAIEPAVAALSEFTSPCIGIFRSRSQRLVRFGPSPCPSDPTMRMHGVGIEAAPRTA